LLLESHSSRSSEMTRDSMSIHHFTSAVCSNNVRPYLTPLPRDCDFHGVRGCPWPWEVLQFRYYSWNYRSITRRVCFPILV